MRWLLLLISLSACGRSELISPLAKDGGAVCAPVSNADAELKRRWNLSADAVPTTNDFHWTGDFPHPTYRGGTPEAYREAADVLLHFWRASGNLDFVTCEGLLDRSYPKGVNTGTTSLGAFTRQLADFTNFVPDAQRAELTQLCSTLGC